MRLLTIASIALLAACSDSKTVGSETTVAAATSDSVVETVPVTDAATTTVRVADMPKAP